MVSEPLKVRNLVLHSDLQNLGNFYIKKGLRSLSIKDFDGAANFIKVGLNFVTCICGYSREKKYSFKVSIADYDFLFDNQTSTNAVNFLKGFVALYANRNQKDLVWQGLESIKNYQNVPKFKYCNYGIFIEALLQNNIDGNFYRLHSISKRLICAKSYYSRYSSWDNIESLNQALEVLIESPSSICGANNLSSKWTKICQMRGMSYLSKNLKLEHSFGLHDLLNGKPVFSEGCMTNHVDIGCNLNFDQSTFLNSYSNLLKEENDFRFESILQSENKTNRNFFNFIENLKNNLPEIESHLKRIHNEIIEEHRKKYGQEEKYLFKTRNNQISDEETVMKALRNNQGDKLGY